MSNEDYLLSLFTNKPGSQISEPIQISQKASPFIKYYKDALTVKYVGKGLYYGDITAVQSNNPANQDALIYYYEVKINNIGERGDMAIGLGEYEFPANKHPGLVSRSYGYRADGKVYNSKLISAVQMPKITGKCHIGCGINYFKREVFFTYNGQYFGPAFKDIEIREYYPTVSLHSPNECVTFNFGVKPFKFDIAKMILEEKKQGISNILEQSIDFYTLHQVVHSYLNFHAYAETLKAFERVAQMERKDVGLPRKEAFFCQEKEEKIEEQLYGKLENGGLGDDNILKTKEEEGEMEIEIQNDGQAYARRESNITEDERECIFRSNSFPFDSENPDSQSNKIFENLGKNNQSKDFMLFRKASMHVNKTSNNHSSTILEATNINNASKHLNSISENHYETDPNIKYEKTGLKNGSDSHSTYLIKERAYLRELLLEGKIEEAIDYIKSVFPGLLEESDEVMKVLHIQQFIEYIKIKDQYKALQYAQKNLTKYQKSTIYCLDEQGIPKESPIDDVMALLCYVEPEESNLKRYLTLEQRDLTADIVNKSILSRMGYLDKSILDVLLGHLTQIHQRFREQKVYYGQNFEFKV